MTPTPPPPGLPISFEFFPPKTPEGAEQAARRAPAAVRAAARSFARCTYGAGGSTQEGTFATVRDILAEGQERGLALFLHRRHARVGAR